MIVTPRQLTDDEKLDRVQDIIQSYFNDSQFITNEIPLSNQYSIIWQRILQITGNSFSLVWEPDIRILNESGGIKRPSFSE